MAKKTQVSLWLRGLLALVAILFLPMFVIQLVRPDALDPHARRPTFASTRFRILVDAGLVFNRLHRADIAISRFRDAEQLASQMADGGYGLLQEARVRLAETYLRAGQPVDAEQTYARIVKSSVEAGDALIAKNQYEAAVPKYEYAELFSQKLATDGLASQLNAERRLAGCLVALKRDRELDPVYTRMIATMRERAIPGDVSLGDTYRSLALARSAVNNWAGAEAALLEADKVYDQIIQDFRGRSDSNAGLLAKQNKDFLTWDFAICYYNEKKTELALSTAENTFQILSQRGGPRNVPIGVYTVGLRAATDLKDQKQVGVWQQRLNDLSPNHPPIPEGNTGAATAQTPLH